MSKRNLRPAVVFACLLLLRQVSFASDSSNAALDYSKEAFVIQQLTSRFTFENDGSERREMQASIKVLSDAGVQKWGVLSFSYQNFSQTVEIEYVRVRKADGSVVISPPENVQDLTSEISRVAPLYTDQREKHVAVKGLAPGDAIEYSIRTETTKPTVPGQFWMQYAFEHDEIVTQETLEVSVPAPRTIKLKNRGPKYEVVTQGDRRIYKWSSSHLERTKDDEEDNGSTWKQARGRADPPDVLLSSFASWDEVGRWYDNLQQERIKPSAQIKEKTAQLVKDAPDDDAKLQAIYNYVSTKFRYIGIDLGMGRYQPHFASDVMDNGYGDCKDKHTLLASLLMAAGFKVYPALVDAQAEVDPDVPSPGQFNHVITVVERKNGRLWLDTTPEVAPFGFLLAPLRGKNALIIPPGSSSVLAMTPDNPDSKSSQSFEMKATLDENGTLTGDAERVVAGSDFEVLLRSGFRSVPMPQWKDLVQQISYVSGFGGDISEVNATSPEELGKPFRISYKYTRKKYSDWENRRISPPLPVLYLPDVKEGQKPSRPLWLGVPGEIHFHSTIRLPKGYYPTLPKAVHIRREFADYDSSYSFDDGVLTAERDMVIKLQEVPTGDYEDYKSLRKTVDDDYATYTSLSIGRSASTQFSYESEIWNLPYSENSEAARLYDTARDQYQRNDMAGEIASLKRAVEIDPKFVRAWLWLGQIYKASRQNDLALAAYRRAIEIDPEQSVSYKALAFTLTGISKPEEAILVWEQYAKVAPGDFDAFANWGGALFYLKRYREAVSPLETAVKLAPENPSLQVLLGMAYLEVSDIAQARKSFQNALALNSDPLMLNNVAYALAQRDADLQEAKDYAVRAVHQEEEDSAKTELPQLRLEDLNHPRNLALFWHTLGMVYYHLNDLPSAEAYLKASWVLSQDPVIGSDLAKLYEKENRKQLALQTYELADIAPAVMAKLFPALGGNAPFAKDEVGLQDSIRRLGGTPGNHALWSVMNDLRTSKLPRLVSGTASAQFFVLFEAGKRVEVRFISGADSLKDAGNALQSVQFNVPFPDQHPTRILRRGILGCYPSTGCSFVTLSLDSMSSLE